MLLKNLFSSPRWAFAVVTIGLSALAPLSHAAGVSPAQIAAEQRRAGPDIIHSSLNTPLDVASRAALITNAETGEVLYSKNTHQRLPIASITKLMTAMVVLDAHQSMDELITITDADIDQLRHTHSRLSVGTRLPRADLMLLALMSSENRAASALIRNHPGGLAAGVAAMNRKARSLGMPNTQFFDGTGLHGENVSTPSELTKMVQAAYRYPDIRAFSTTPEYSVTVRGQEQRFRNTNGLVKKPDWEIDVSKTGFINEAGRCLVMMAHIRDIPVVIVLMDSLGKYTRIGDANRVKSWLEVAIRN
ncbi:MAG: D-alanyl-D-alanine endopeptidase [Paraperlucidibaca sp.]